MCSAHRQSEGFSDARSATISPTLKWTYGEAALYLATSDGNMLPDTLRSPIETGNEVNNQVENAKNSETGTTGRAQSDGPDTLAAHVRKEMLVRRPGSM